MSRPVLADLDFVGFSRILNLPDGTLPQHPATVAQLNAAIEGLSPKDSARVSTQANLNLAAPGASIDAIAMAANDRVLVRAQTAQTENGVYIWNGAATPMTRAPDANTASELEAALVTVEEGTDAGTTWRQTSVNFVLGTNNIVWVSHGSATPDASETVKGKIEIATQAETDAGTDDLRAITPLKLKSSSLILRKSELVFGDGSATQFTFTHNFNTRSVGVEVYRNSGNFDTIICDVDRISVNAVRCTFAAAPPANGFVVQVIG